jgi:hypothetical protein
MDARTQAKEVGRPPVPEETLEEVRRLLEAGEKPNAVRESTGVNLTKIYEIRRHMPKKEAPTPDSSKGLLANPEGS